MGYRLPAQGKTLERPSHAPTYRLQAMRTPTVTPSRPRPLPAHQGVRRGSYGHDQLIRERLEQTRQPRTPRASTFSILRDTQNPTPAKAGRAVVTFTVATEAELPGLLGGMRLRLRPEQCDVGRCSFGVLSLLRSHDLDQPIGRILQLQHVQQGRAYLLQGRAEISNTPRAQATLDEIREGALVGVSPGFLVQKMEAVERNGDDLLMDVVKSEVYEVSVTTAARNRFARIHSIGGTTMSMSGELVSTSDLVGLEIAAIKVALRSDTGTERQRAAFRHFLSEFERLSATGLDRDSAAKQAAQAAKRAA